MADEANILRLKPRILSGEQAESIERSESWAMILEEREGREAVEDDMRVKKGPKNLTTSSPSISGL